MKIAKDRLKQIIKEELDMGMIQGSDTQTEGHEDADGNMAKSNLYKIIEYAQELYELIDDSEDLEPWVEEKIAIAGYMMDSVGHYMRYEKHKSGEGEVEGGSEEEYELDLPDEEGDMEYGPEDEE